VGFAPCSVEPEHFQQKKNAPSWNLSIKRHQKTPIAMMGAKNTFACPIIQALAPCRSVGCCAVYELVSRALFIGKFFSF
jgi:hypothetical protein